MPAQDIFYQAPKNALIKDGWTIAAINSDLLFMSTSRR